VTIRHQKPKQIHSIANEYMCPENIKVN